MSPVETKSVRPSITPWARMCSATGWRLFPSSVPYCAFGFWSGLTGSRAGLERIGLSGPVSHSPKEAFACRGPLTSLTHAEKSAATSASASEEAK